MPILVNYLSVYVHSLLSRFSVESNKASIRNRKCSENVDIRSLRSKGQRTAHESAKIPKRRFCLRFLIHGYLPFKDDLD